MDNKIKVISGITALVLLIALFISSLFFTKSQPIDTTQEKTQEETKIDLELYVTGITDRTIVIESTGIDYMYQVIYDQEMITSIDIDDSLIDLNTEGDYPIVYTLHGQDQDINIERTIHVVSLETAQSEADAGKTVYSDDNEVVKKTGQDDEHEHTWVHHNATGHYETQVTTAARDVPVYQTHAICDYCGSDITGQIESHLNTCQGTTYSTQQVQTGTQHQEATTSQVWVVDQEAYDSCACGERR